MIAKLIDFYHVHVPVRFHVQKEVQSRNKSFDPIRSYITFVSSYLKRILNLSLYLSLLKI